MHEYRELQDLITEIVLESAVHKGSFLFLEGKDDWLILNRYVDENNCSVTCCFGKHNVLGVVEGIRELGISGMIGVIDRDYGEFVGDVNDPDICFSNFNDLEVDLLNSDALNRFLIEYGSHEKIEALTRNSSATVVEYLAHCYRAVGALRVVGKRRGLNLKFKGMNFHFCSQDSLEIDVERQVRHVIGRSEEICGLTDKDALIEINILLEEVDDPMKLAHGHDLCRMLGIGLRRLLGSINDFREADGGSAIEKILRLSTDRNVFESLRLFVCIGEWERRNPPYKVLPT